jgi:hypothetical protein
LLEVGRVPAATLQLESGGGKQFFVAFCAALRAGVQNGVAQLLQVFFLKAAIGATIFVNGHDESPRGQIL